MRKFFCTVLFFNKRFLFENLLIMIFFKTYTFFQISFKTYTFFQISFKTYPFFQIRFKIYPFPAC